MCVCVCIHCMGASLSTMLRALVLEKESRLRELILIMGTSLQAYYASILATYGLTFIVIAVISASEIGFSCEERPTVGSARLARGMSLQSAIA